MEHAAASAHLQKLRGIGPWTAGVVLGLALGDPDAVPWGDYNLPSLVAFNLADTWFVAQLGELQLAAISFTFPVVMAIGSVALGLGVGAAATIAAVIAGVPAKQIGERDSARANRLNAWLYHRNKQAYERGDHRTWVGDEYRAWLKAKQAEIDEDRDLLGL